MEHAWDYRPDDTVVCWRCGLDYKNLEAGMESSCYDRRW